MTVLAAAAIVAGFVVVAAAVLHVVSRIGTGEQNARGRLPDGMLSGPTHTSARTGLGDKAPVRGIPAMFASAVGESAVTGTAGVEPVNPCGAGVRVLDKDDWGIRWHD